jgi:hypothetical protein
MRAAVWYAGHAAIASVVKIRKPRIINIFGAFPFSFKGVWQLFDNLNNKPHIDLPYEKR